MTSVLELFPKTQKLAYETRQQLSQVQNRLMPASELFLSLEELNRQLNIMEGLVGKERPSQREIWIRKIRELRAGSLAVRREAENFDRIISANYQHEQQRSKLMARRRRRGNESDQQNLADEANSLDQSKVMMNEIIASGTESLRMMRDQSARLKSVKRTVLDIGNKLGLSNSVMKSIEKRDATDFYIVMGGIVIILFILYLAWFIF